MHDETADTQTVSVLPVAEHLLRQPDSDIGAEQRSGTTGKSRCQEI
jgi:hypothetical protein